MPFDGPRPTTRDLNQIRAICEQTLGHSGFPSLIEAIGTLIALAREQGRHLGRIAAQRTINRAEYAMKEAMNDMAISAEKASEAQIQPVAMHHRSFEECRRDLHLYDF